MTNKEAVNWLINLIADIEKSEHHDLWHYEQALDEIKEMLEGKDTNVPSNNILRHPSCKNRTSIGNCDPVGGFCSSVPKDICAKYYVTDTDVGDTISRQAAIDECNKRGAEHIGYAISHLPPAEPERPEQPESAKEYCAECDHIEMCRWYPYEGCDFRSLPSAQSEIIHCKDCIYHNKDINQCDRQVCAVMYADDFCNYGERRGEQDEQENNIS